MTDNKGLEKWMERVESKVDNLIETNFTKNDMENFKRDVCSPSRACQTELEKRVQKTEKFQARLSGMVAAVTAIWGLLITIIGLKHGR
jgi:hypothetical protein